MRIISILLISLLFLSIYLFLGQRFAWNFIFAFLSFCSIIFAVSLTQKHKIQRLITNATQEELEALAMSYQDKEDKEEELWRENDNPPLKKGKIQGKYRAFWRNFDKSSSKIGIKIFFMPIRLFAYAFLVLGFLVLLKQDFLDIIGFFSGLVVANIVIVVFYLFKMK